MKSTLVLLPLHQINTFDKYDRCNIHICLPIHTDPRACNESYEFNLRMGLQLLRATINRRRQKEFIKPKLSSSSKLMEELSGEEINSRRIINGQLFGGRMTDCTLLLIKGGFGLLRIESEQARAIKSEHS